MKKYKVVSMVRRFLNLTVISLMLSLVVAPIVFSTPIAFAKSQNYSHNSSNYSSNNYSSNSNYSHNNLSVNNNTNSSMGSRHYGNGRHSSYGNEPTTPVIPVVPVTPVVPVAPVVPVVPVTPVVPVIPVVPTTPASSLKWGVFLPDSSLSSFEQTVGQQADMQATFVGWNTNFPTSDANSLKASGKTLVIFWENTGTSLDQIIAGNSDAYLSSFAAQAKASGASVILAPLHEMNGNWDTWDGTVGSNTPAKVISTWKHIHDAFAGVSNVKFAWDVNNVSVPNTSANSINSYYPGDAYVDYVAVDGFNFDSDSWDQVFPSSLMNQLSFYNKPVYILSTASVPGSQKAQWIKDMGAHIKNYPGIAGWVWFNQNGGDGNWLVDSDSDSLAAFKSILP
jgi:mannan endo-1,4-beta-mannosidase